MHRTAVRWHLRRRLPDMPRRGEHDRSFKTGQFRRVALNTLLGLDASRNGRSGPTPSDPADSVDATPRSLSHVKELAISFSQETVASRARTRPEPHQGKALRREISCRRVSSGDPGATRNVARPRTAATTSAPTSRDEGYRDCCDWWPCSWACRAWTWISNIVCVVWTWVSNVVCVAWTWITTFFCVLWDIVTTVVNAVLGTLESIFGWVLSAIAFVIELLEMIPILGALIRWVINFVTFLINTVLSLGDMLLGLLGIRPEKKLRLCTIILRDEEGKPVGTVDDAVKLLQLAADVYKRDANVRVVPLRAFQYSSGFGGAETVDASWVTGDDANSDSTVLDVGCGGSGAGADWTIAGNDLSIQGEHVVLLRQLAARGRLRRARHLLPHPRRRRHDGRLRVVDHGLRDHRGECAPRVTTERAHARARGRTRVQCLAHLRRRRQPQPHGHPG